MRKLSILAAAGLVAVSGMAQAENREIEGNVAYATDYVFRGVSQTDNAQALQGGFDWAHDSGFYVGTWASNVDSSFFATATDPQLEVDYYAGFAGEAGELGYDVGVIHYNYPSADAADTEEVYVYGSYGVASLGVNYADELAFVGSDESAYYLDLGLAFELPAEVGLGLHAGYSGGDAFENDVGGAGSPDSYIDYSVTLSKSLAGVDLSAAYVASDSDGETLFSERLAEGRVVLTVARSF